ncbi:Histidine kinase protein, partial [Dioscorea alata]
SDSGFKNNLRVLVVDDDKMVRNITMAMLRTLKVEGKEAVNGKEAVDLFVAGEDFNLVLMDREMPVMTGLEATKYLRGMGVRVKLVGVSARSMDKEKQDFLDAGADEFFAKPMTCAKLSALLQEVDENL